MNTKRIFDVAAASGGLILSAPIILGAAFSMAAANRQFCFPIFTQKRVGLNGKEFTIYKIKSMRDLTDKNGRAFPDEIRTTAVGKFLRKSRIDELPQLFNIAKGDMSLVGPRPLPCHTDNAKDEKRHQVRPGLTGPAQIAGKNGLTNKANLRLDHSYVDNNSFLGDLRIIFATPLSLITNRNVPHFKADAQSYNSKEL